MEISGWIGQQVGWVGQFGHSVGVVVLGSSCKHYLSLLFFWQAAAWILGIHVGSCWCQSVSRLSLLSPFLYISFFPFTRFLIRTLHGARSYLVSLSSFFSTALQAHGMMCQLLTAIDRQSTAWLFSHLLSNAFGLSSSWLFSTSMKIPHKGLLKIRKTNVTLWLITGWRLSGSFRLPLILYVDPFMSVLPDFFSDHKSTATVMSQWKPQER